MEIINTSINVGNGFDRHNHVSDGVWELHFLLENGGIFTNGGEQYAGKSGGLFLSLPHMYHEAKVGPDEFSITIYSVSFLPSPADFELLEMLTERFTLESCIQTGKGNALVFEDIRTKNVSGIYLRKRSAELTLASFLYDLLAGQTKDVLPRGQMYVDYALSDMQDHLRTSIDLEDLCRRLGIDKSYFIRLFKKVTGMSPMHYFIHMKMEAAKTSLLVGSKPVRDVAIDFGYADEFYFSRLFKKYQGLSPAALRNTGAGK